MLPSVNLEKFLALVNCLASYDTVIQLVHEEVKTRFLEHIRSALHGFFLYSNLISIRAYRNKSQNCH